MAAASPLRAESSFETKSITVVWKLGDVSDVIAPAAAPSNLLSPHFDNKRWSLCFTVGTEDPQWCGLYLLAHFEADELGDDGKYRRESPVVKCELFDAQEHVVLTNTIEDKDWTSDMRSGKGWGRKKWRRRDDAVFAGNKGPLTMRATLSLAPYLPSPPLPPPPPARPLFSDSLATAYKTFFEDEQASDVRFLVGREGSPRRLLRANKAFLSKRSEYFRSMFSSDFSEGASGHNDNEDRPSKRRKVERSSGPSPSPEAGSALSAWQDDDDSLEWLPQEWLEEHGPQDVKEEPVEGGEADKGMIKVTDAGYITYRAMLYFLYTERITFTPSASNFTVAFATNETNNQSRRAYLLSKSQGGDGDVEPASPHAVYRLADKLDMGELKKLAREAIVIGFTADNILYELISSFAYHYDEIQKAALEFAWKNWDAVKSTPAFARVLAGASDIEGGSTILAKLVMGTTVTKAG